MGKKNNLSRNLKVYQEVKKYSLAEFSKELGIPKSTLSSVMQYGNTTLDTALRMAERLGVSLDELVCNKELPKRLGFAHLLLTGVEWYVELPADKQEQVAFHLNEILKVVSK